MSSKRKATSQVVDLTNEQNTSTVNRNNPKKVKRNPEPTPMDIPNRNGNNLLSSSMPVVSSMSSSPGSSLSSSGGTSSSTLGNLRNSSSSVSTAAKKKPLAASGTHAGPAKKLVIKGFDKKPQLPENFEEETWKKLEAAVRAIHHKTSVAHSLEELYKASEDLCFHKMAPALYTKLQNECENHIKAELMKLLAKNPPDNVIFLNYINACWQDHTDQMPMIRSIFLYLDRTYVIQNANVRSLWDMGLAMFRQHIALHSEVERRTVSGLLILIEKERMGEKVDRSLLKNLLRMFSALNIYADHFEKAFLDSTKAFYTKEGIALMQELEVPAYLLHVERRLHEENERITHYLDPSTKKALILVVEKQLLEPHAQALLEKGFDNLVTNNRKEDLSRLYSLLHRINFLDKLKVAWNSYIKSTGTEMIMDQERDKNMVQELLDYKAKLDIILEEAFRKNEIFVYALKEGFEHFINVRKNKPAEFVAKFVDDQLRAGNKVTEEELENLLDKVMTLFRYIQGKDIFEAFYKKDLAKRLLLNKSSSIDEEKSMISKLKTECGSNFTNKLEGMFKDIDISKDLMIAFKQSKFSEKAPIDLSVNVLTTGYWPPYVPVDIILPGKMAEVQEKFQEFYMTKHSRRRLMWHHPLGHCTLKANFKNGRKELLVSLFQTCVLVLFNDADQLSFSDIKTRTGLEEKELKRTLQSLACAKVKLLLKSSKGREVDDNDTFTFYADFSYKLYRIKINSIQVKETVEENTKTTESVFQDRQYQIDAAIVRIMKTRKTLSHNQLIAELYNQLKFPLKPVDMKKRIESLIEREYLERDQANSQIYNYLA